METKEKLIRDIETLKTSIKSDWQDIASKQLSNEEKIGIRDHILWCIDELNQLVNKL